MAKKTRKRSVSSPAAVAQTASTTTAAQKATTSRSSEFNPDYSYVRKDLKRIGILASSFFVILIVLSFFLR